MLSRDEAVRELRRDPAYTDLVRDAYIGADVAEAADRFCRSAEWAATAKLVGAWLPDAAVVDLGAGNGIASHAFARSGAAIVYAIEPDTSEAIGLGAMQHLELYGRVVPTEAMGEQMPIESGAIDIVYARQVLHHIGDLASVLAEVSRVLRPGGAFLAVREHVVRNEADLQAFLEHHPVHRLAGGENAYTEREYLDAIRGAGLKILAALGPWDSVITAFPMARSEVELSELARTTVRDRFGPLGSALIRVPGVESLMWRRIRRHTPGELHAFMAIKPEARS